MNGLRVSYGCYGLQCLIIVNSYSYRVCVSVCVCVRVRLFVCTMRLTQISLPLDANSRKLLSRRPLGALKATS